MADAASFDGRVLLVTGAAGGIGRATAIRAVARGARLVLCDLDGAGAAALAKELGPKAAGFAIDVTDAQAVKLLFDLVRAQFGRLDGLVCAAGLTGEAAPLAECKLETWHAVVGVNLTGMFQTMRAAIPLMLESGGGSIVNISSVAGIVAVPNQAQYIASKFGVIGLTKAAAADYAAQGIRANAVCPGGTRTPMLAEWVESDPTRERFLAAAHPIGRIAEPREIADAILWLLSDQSSFVTGAVLPVDGGLTLG